MDEERYVTPRDPTANNNNSNVSAEAHNDRPIVNALALV